MTAKKKLKQRVRERMKETGESYCQALAWFRANDRTCAKLPLPKKDES